MTEILSGGSPVTQASPPDEADLVGMRPGDPTLVARDVHVHYRVDVSKARRLRSLFAAERQPERKVHAVRGVSLTARRGEIIGLLGRNGAGKSTLLTAMTGLLPVTSGSIHAVAQPVRLGVSAALQPMLPARENVILGGLALGMTRDEAVDAVGDIIAFAGIGDAAERPLNTYSSGMRARIQFSIATAASPEILMVDETLGVGDSAFRKRSRNRIKELAEQAGTVFVVSHSLNQIRKMCTRGIWLEQGEVQVEGDLEEVADAYDEFMEGQD